MRSIFAVTIAALLCATAPAVAQTPATVKMCVQTTPTTCVPVSSVAPFPASDMPYNFTPLTPDQHNLAIVSSTALTIPIGSLQAVVCVSGNAVKYTYDGTTTPTALIGMPLANGQCIQFSGATVLANLRFIQTAATATLDVSYTK